MRMTAMMAKRAVLAGSAGLVAMIAGAAPAMAADAAPARAAVADARTFYVTLGADFRVRPTFYGGDSSKFFPFPVGSISIGPPVRRFSSIKDGASIGLFDQGMVRAGAVIGAKWHRREKDDRVALRGLGNVDFAIEPGVFAEVYPVAWLRGRVEVRHGFGGHSGTLADVSADAFGDVLPGWRLSAGPRLSLASSDYAQTYFGVNAVQSARSGLPVFSPGGGVKSYGVGTALQWRATDAIIATAYAEYERLAGDIGRAPLVRQRGSRDQAMFGLRVTYSFDTGIASPF